MTEQDKTLLTTILVHLERAKEGTINAFPDIHGSWEMVQKPPTSGLVRYFTPQYQEGYDQYGSPSKSDDLG